MNKAQSRQEWLEGLQVGDKVVVVSHYNGMSICSVEKITKTGRINVTNKQVFAKDGYQFGGSVWHRSYIEPLTQENINAIERGILINKISKFKFGSLSLEQLREIKKIIDAV